MFELTPREVMEDVYFLPDFVALHAYPDKIDCLDEDNYRHYGAIRTIGSTGWTDIETPHGYGGPVSTSLSNLTDGLEAWKLRQRQYGRVAELIRFHPCVNPEVFSSSLNYLALNRMTVMIDISHNESHRLSHYSITTRQNIKKTRQKLSIRLLDKKEWRLLKYFYEQMLIRQHADARYYFCDNYYQEILAKEWCYSFIVELDHQPLGAACFLSSTSPLAHYHLSGASDTGLRQRVHYLLIDEACKYFSQRGKRWLHLGGGRSTAPDDSLWLFKAQFSKIHSRFFIGGIIHDSTTYKALGGASDGLFLGYRAKLTTVPSST